LTNRRTRLAIIGAVAVLLLCVGIGFYLLTRSTPADPTPPPATPTVPSASVSPSPSYQPTDQYGSPEPALPQGEAEAGAGGTTEGPAGLPLGYSHDETGAVNAATNYLMWMNSLKITDKNTADSLAAATAVNEKTRRALVESFDTLRSGMAGMTADQHYPARGAFAVANYTSDRALVYVWSPEVITEATGRTEHVWGMAGITVVWTDNDWKLDGALINKVGAAAVDPADPAGDPSAAEKHSILSRTPADPGEITDTSDQSWFEYANAPH
jgi:hypothetical protein